MLQYLRISIRKNEIITKLNFTFIEWGNYRMGLYKKVLELKEGSTIAIEEPKLNCGICLSKDGAYRVYQLKFKCYICGQEDDCNHALDFPNSFKFTDAGACANFVVNNIK